jgi:uncharacterized membrane-anchored protein
MGKSAFIVFAVLAFASPAIAEDQILTEEQRITEIKAMHWIKQGLVTLPDSKGSVALPSGYAAVVGPEAQRLSFLMDALSDDHVEAIVVNASNSDEVVFNYFNDGFVNADDWGKVDAEAMLNSIKESTDQANLGRQKQKLDSIITDGWLQAPKFNPASNTAFWALSAHINSTRLVNAIALRLGRYGYEKLNWITNSERYKPAGGDLEAILGAHSFAPGASYTDHLEGDKLAGYGIASLVAVVAGAKIAKVIGAGALILLAKKFGVVALAALAGAFAWIRRKLSNRTKG